MPQDYKISQAAIIDSRAWDASCSRAEIVFEPPLSNHIRLFSLRLSCHHGFTLVEQLNEGHWQSRVCLRVLSHSTWRIIKGHWDCSWCEQAPCKPWNWETWRAEQLIDGLEVVSFSICSTGEHVVTTQVAQGPFLLKWMYCYLRKQSDHLFTSTWDSWSPLPHEPTDRFIWKSRRIEYEGGKNQLVALIYSMKLFTNHIGQKSI